MEPIVIVGIGAQTLVVLSGLAAVWTSLERRLTRLETKMDVVWRFLHENDRAR